ncbi:hypothetical protein OG21DRAFT_1415843 [Imleria badia]|nr:hypothetical protein OG21DRAFT_1415843 [Imleria badia]
MNAHEYFNLRHAQLRSVVERAIYLLKQRFRILVVAPEADMDSQARIPSALCCIHNIIRRFDPEDVSAPAYARSTGKSKDKSSEACGSFAKYGFVTIAERDRMRENREKIASWLWKDRLGQYPRSQDYDV